MRALQCARKAPVARVNQPTPRAQYMYMGLLLRACTPIYPILLCTARQNTHVVHCRNTQPPMHWVPRQAGFQLNRCMAHACADGQEVGRAHRWWRPRSPW